MAEWRYSSQKQINKIAKFIEDEIPGEPSNHESVSDCVIRLLRKAYLNEDRQSQ